MSTSPDIQVVIPAWNPDTGLLDQAIESALACRGVTRALVIDDGSEPPIPDHAVPAGANVFRQPHAGVSAARNRGLDAADGEYALLLDHDDRLLPGGVARMIELAGRTNAAAVVSARIETSAEGSQRLRPVPEGWEDSVLDRPGRVFKPIALFGGSGVLVHRRTFAPSGAGLRFDEALSIGEDRDFLRRAADVGPIAVCAEPSLVVRLGGLLTGARNYPRRARDLATLIDRHFSTVDEAYWHEAVRWMINAAARSGVDDETWGILTRLARLHRWPIPVKARVRRAIRGAVQRG